MRAESSGGDDIFILLSSQLLYSTYLLSSARRTIGVDEGMSWELHHRMMPAFEELFDEVEEHALNVLLEPWMLLLDQNGTSFQKVTSALLFHVQGDNLTDRAADENNSPLRQFHVLHIQHLNLFFSTLCLEQYIYVCVLVKVCVWEDVRSVNSLEYQELQSLYEDSQLQLKQVSPLSRVS